MRKTGLWEEHVQLGARMVEFAGWNMPVQYKGLREEHQATRTAIGVFDVSHMGEIWFRGPKALESLQWMTTNDVSKLQSGQAQYGLIGNDLGGIVDDIIVYCVQPQSEYLVCVNAANVEKDYQWFVKHKKGAEIANESDQWSQLAIQGPKAFDLLGQLFSEPLKDLPSFHFAWAKWQNVKCLIARTGYTGETGVEVFIPNEGVRSLWQAVIEKGRPLGLEPVGLGARDTLRTEMKYSLYGHEITDETTPYEAGLGWAVKPQAKDFVGKAPMLKSKESPTRKLIGFKLKDKGIARENYAITDAGGQVVGQVTSGTLSPTLNEAVGIGYVPVEMAKVGAEIWVDIRGRRALAVVVDTPFVKR